MKEIVYVTKYLFTRGIIEVESNISEYGSVSFSLWGNPIYKPYWYKNKEEAFNHAKIMLNKKIQSLEIKLQKLKNFEIEIVTI